MYAQVQGIRPNAIHWSVLNLNSIVDSVFLRIIVSIEHLTLVGRCSIKLQYSAEDNLTCDFSDEKFHSRWKVQREV